MPIRHPSFVVTVCADPKNFFHRRSFFLFVFCLVCLFVFLINICVAFYNCFHDCLWDCTVFFVCLLPFVHLNPNPNPNHYLRQDLRPMAPHSFFSFR